jgi:benzodiazapine receptor
VAALLILVVMAGVALGLNPSREEFRWFLKLRRPAWLTFERWIPLIWLVIYSCFYASALISWNRTGRWDLMAAYLLLLLLVQSYVVVICRTRRIRNGTVVGVLGWVWGMGLTIGVVPVAMAAWLLLLPYLIWSPIGSFVSWQMQRINR